MLKSFCCFCRCTFFLWTIKKGRRKCPQRHSILKNLVFIFAKKLSKFVHLVIESRKDEFMPQKRIQEMEIKWSLLIFKPIYLIWCPFFMRQRKWFFSNFSIEDLGINIYLHILGRWTFVEMYIKRGLSIDLLSMQKT